MNEPDRPDLEPAEVVRRFVADMHAWEMQAAADFHATQPQGSEAFWDRARTSQAEVFARWCTDKARPQGRNGSFAQPPEYQPEYEQILETRLESSRQAVVETQQGTGFKNKVRYTLLKKAGRWRIDNKKRARANGQWVKHFL